jgi:hypothetical protein
MNCDVLERKYLSLKLNRRYQLLVFAVGVNVLEEYMNTIKKRQKFWYTVVRRLV